MYIRPDSRIGRRVTISIGIILMAVLNALIALSPSAFLITPLAKLPLLGTIRVLNVFLMGGGVAWSLININSLPMVVDLTTLARVGTFTGLYYLFSTLAAIVGPNLYGRIVQLNGGDYNTMMFASPVFLIVALVLMLGVHRGEAVSS